MASELRVNTSTNRSGLGTITYTDTGAIVSGIITANSASFTGSVSIGGTLTYEDVTNIDSVGLITARGGINVSGGTLKIPTVAGANTNANLNVLFQTAAGVIDGGSGLQYNPSQDVLKVNGNHIDLNTFRGDGDLGTLTCDNHSSTTFVKVSSKVDLGLKDNTAGAFNIKEGSNEYITIDTTNSSELIKFTTAGAERFKINNDGSSDFTVAGTEVDIYGTGAGNRWPLRLFNSDTTSGNMTGIYFGPCNNVAGAYVAGKAEADFTSTANRDAGLVFGVRLNGNFSEPLNIKSDGKIGVNRNANMTTWFDINHGSTSTPETNLMLSGSGITAGGGTGIFLKSSSNTTLNRYGSRIHSIREAANNGASTLVISNENAGASALAEALRITSDGTVLVGTTNNTTIGTVNKNLIVGSTTNNDEVAMTLNVMEGTHNRRIKLFLDDNDGVFGVDSTASSGVAPFVVRMAASEKMRVNDDGYVGINDPAPEVRFHVYEPTGTGGTRTLAMFQKNHTSTALSGNMASNGYPHAVILENQDNSSDAGLTSLCFSKWTSGSQSQAVIAGISESAGNMALTFNTESGNSIGERVRITSAGLVGIKQTPAVSQLEITHAGTSTPLNQIELNTSNVTDGGGSGIFLKNSGATGSSHTNRYGSRIHTIRESNGASNLVFSTESTSGTGLGEAMRINPKQHVTKPKNPYFVVQRSSVISGTGYVTFDTVVNNNGSHYSTSNGRFTAPTTGFYQFFVKLNVFKRVDIQLRRNANTSGSANREITQFNTSNHDGWWSCLLSRGMHLDANDYVQVWVNVLTQNSDPGEWLTFQGYLVG